MKHLKKMLSSCLILLFFMLLTLPATVKAAESNADSEVTISFSEKTIKGKTKDPDPKKIVDPTKKVTKTDPTKKVTGDVDNGKTFYKALPKTGEVSNNTMSYVGFTLVLLSVLSYKIVKKERTINE